MDSRQFNIDLLTRKLRDAEVLLERQAFGDAMSKVSGVLAVAEEQYMGDIVTRARDVQQKILERLDAFKHNCEVFRGLQDAVENNLKEGRSQEVARDCEILIQLAPAVRKNDVAKKYRIILDDARSEIPASESAAGESRAPNKEENPPTVTKTELVPTMPQANRERLEHKVVQLRRVEEIFQNEFIDGHYTACVDVLSLLIGLCEEVGDIDKRETFYHVKEIIKNHLPDQGKMVLLNPEMAEAIERQKRVALNWERQLKFEEARKVYDEVLRMAMNMKDYLTATFCEHRLVQLAVWEEEMATSDLTPWGILPFRLLFQSRFDCMEVFPDRAAAEARKQALNTQRVNPDNVKIVTIIRSRFKGQGPFDARGTCYALYIRRVWDLEE